MKQRQILHPEPPERVLGIIDKDSFAVPTIVTGKVLDEKGTPAIGTKVSFFGRESKKSGVYITFDIVQSIGIDGSYKIATIIPRKTESVILRIEFSDYNFFLYTFDIKVNGRLNSKTNSVKISAERYGKETVVDFQLRRL